jgi:chromosome partitioning protein
VTRTLAVFNMKGGVAKSTTVYNLAAGLVKFKQQRVLVVDIDPQGNAAASLGIAIWQLSKQLKDVLQHKAAITDVVIKTASGVDVVPSNILLAEEEIPISGRPGRELLLKKALSPISNQYDFVLIDCPPNVGVFAVNALMASNELIIPVDMSYLGLLGVQGIEHSLTLIREQLDHPIAIAGVLPTRYDRRNNLSKEVLDALKEHFGDAMFETIIPETVKIREAPSHGQSIFEYDPNGTGASAYHQLVEEVYGSK